jgi:hypothetical protein
LLYSHYEWPIHYSQQGLLSYVVLALLPFPGCLLWRSEILSGCPYLFVFAVLLASPAHLHLGIQMDFS